MDHKNLLHKTVFVEYKNKGTDKISYGLVTSENKEEVVLTHTFKEKESVDVTIIPKENIISVTEELVEEVG